MKSSPTVAMIAVVLGGLFALIGWGARGFHPMIGFVMMGGMVFAIGCAINGAVDKAASAWRNRK